MRLPAVVRLSRSFWDDARNGTREAKLEFIMRQLAALTARCLVTTLELPKCEMEGPDAERLAGLLEQCPALVHLDNTGCVSVACLVVRGLFFSAVDKLASLSTAAAAASASTAAAAAVSASIVLL